MGKVRTEQVKRIARELLKKYPNKIGADFEKNKQVVTDYTSISSIKLRNKVAGYATRLATATNASEAPEPEEANQK